MAQSCFHLIVLSLVVVLCVVNVSNATAVNNGTAVDETSGDESATTGDPGSYGDTHQTHLSTNPVPDIQTPGNTFSIHRDHHTNNTPSPINKTYTSESNDTESTTLESSTSNLTTIKPITAASTTAGSHNKNGGIAFLIIILIIIIILSAILYILWKKGKKYSFDLTNGEHVMPLQSIEHAGTFEPNKGSTVNLDYIKEDSPNKSSPVANGCPGETPDQTPCSEQENGQEENGFPSNLSLNSPVKKVEFNLDLELIGGEPDLTKQATDEPTDNDNENNNNDMNNETDSSDLFTEINLDDVQ